jgi:non-ribosomal peptide synthetase component F
MQTGQIVGNMVKIVKNFVTKYRCITRNFGNSHLTRTLKSYTAIFRESELHFQPKPLYNKKSRPGTRTIMDCAATTLNLASIVEHHAKLVPEKEAIVCNDVRSNLRDLDALANRVAYALQEMGVGPGDKVALTA